MTPHPTDHPGLLRIPGPALTSVSIRFSPLSNRDHFDPSGWPLHPLAQSALFPGWWEIDLDTLAIADGRYEYEFVADGAGVQDPYADTITRFGGYRGVFTMAGGKRVATPFAWDDEFKPGISLPQNNRIVIYEMPVKWMSSDPPEGASLVELGTIDKVIFEHLDDLAAMGINCIELLPIEDSPQTLNWGYGTRFFFAPDYDIASPVDLKFFIKICHQCGIRVLLDVVMNMFAPQCPLGALASAWFREASSPGRKDWGQDLFHYSTPSYGAYYAAREFLCEMAEFWVANYHVDGFRIDDFADINNWDFIREFRDRAWTANTALGGAKPFLVIAEDSNGRFVTTNSADKIVDAIWNFGYQAEIRRLAVGGVNTVFGQPSRSQRVAHLISKDGVWNDWNHSFDAGFEDMACSVAYVTSHDVQQAPRLANVILGPMLQAAGLGDGGVANVRAAVDNVANPANPATPGIVAAAYQRVFGVFAILMTSVGMPMFLAGEEFGDVHDTDYGDVNSKQQDPVQWLRAALPSNAALKTQVANLIALRVSHPALQRNEVECFYFHPQFDGSDGPWVFAWCRTAGKPLGSTGQVVAVANMGPRSFPVYGFPGWRWGGAALTEVGYMADTPVWNGMTATWSLSLTAFGVRVFTT